MFHTLSQSFTFYFWNHFYSYPLYCSFTAHHVYTYAYSTFCFVSFFSLHNSPKCLKQDAVDILCQCHGVPQLPIHSHSVSLNVFFFPARDMFSPSDDVLYSFSIPVGVRVRQFGKRWTRTGCDMGLLLRVEISAVLCFYCVILCIALDKGIWWRHLKWDVKYNLYFQNYFKHTVSH